MMPWKLEQPEWLILWLAPAGVMLWALRRRRRQAGWIAPALRPWAVVSTGRMRLGSLWALWSGVMLAALALANPQYAVPRVDRQTQGDERTVVLLLDLSRSMRAQDVPPSRIEAARSLAAGLLGVLPQGVRVGLRVFDGASHWAVLPTVDHELVRAYLQAAQVDSLPTRGGRSDWAVWETAEALRMGARLPAALILLSDGHPPYGDEAPVPPTPSADLKGGVRLIVVGIGGNRAAPVPDPRRHDGLTRWRGETLKTPLYAAQLRRLTRTWGGEYWTYSPELLRSAWLERAKASVLAQSLEGGVREAKAWRWHSLRTPVFALAWLALAWAFWPLGGRRA